MNKKKKRINKNLLLLLLAIFITTLPLIINKNAEFAGSDDKAKDAILEIDTNYKPWFSPVFTPPSIEIESLMFSLQVAIGSGIVFYYIGFQKGKTEKNKDKINF